MKKINDAVYVQKIMNTMLVTIFAPILPFLSNPIRTMPTMGMIKLTIPNNIVFMLFNVFRFSNISKLHVRINFSKSPSRQRNNREQYNRTSYPQRGRYIQRWRGLIYLFEYPIRNRLRIRRPFRQQ